MRLHDTVQTPNGVGIVQGALVEEGETTKILVSHDPRQANNEMKQNWRGGPWILFAYGPSEIQIVAASTKGAML